jgi:hypothetical protein
VIAALYYQGARHTADLAFVLAAGVGDRGAQIRVVCAVRPRAAGRVNRRSVVRQIEDSCSALLGFAVI